jgi:DNA replication and repair protein RecF
VRAFRNLKDAALDLPDAGCVMCGPNGHGKTSLIEALLYPEVFRSFRGAADRELVQFGAAGFHVEATVRGGRRVAAGYDARTRQKKVTLDGVETPRLGGAIGVVRGVVLSPGDVLLVAGGPRERRRYLDVLLALTVKGYVEALSRYRRALLHRMRATAAELPTWERLLGDAGALIVSARQAWAERWTGSYGAQCAAMGETGVPAMLYAPRTAGNADALSAALEQSRERDRIMGHVSVGPHRDELRLTLDGRPLRSYGSAGQQRTAALALRLIEAEAMAEAGGSALICLDDAFAELDGVRSRKLGELIAARAAAGSQIVAAVPKESDVPDVIGALPRWSMREGMVSDGA